MSIYNINLILKLPYGTNEMELPSFPVYFMKGFVQEELAWKYLHIYVHSSSTCIWSIYYAVYSADAIYNIPDLVVPITISLIEDCC